jgi:hypothetical protein
VLSSIAKQSEHLIAPMENIDHIICNVVFECLVLDVYINSSIASPSKYAVYFYFHVDVIDTMVTTVIIMNIEEL